MLTKSSFSLTALAIGALSLFTGCQTTGGDCCGTCGDTCSTAAAPSAIEMPTTADEQSKATPQAVLAQLMAGNARYVAGQRTPIALKESREAATAGQWPVAYVLSCVDSRVPVEVVFDQGIGDLFVGRVAGNFENVDQLGSMEFATAAAGAKLVLVLGHEACGAIKGAIDDVKLGNLTDLLAELKPATAGISGEKTSKNKAFVDKVIEANVKKTVSDIRSRSAVLSGLEKEGKIMIVGGIYSLETGKVTLLDM